MCLVLFAWKQHPDIGLVLAANRDEYYERPSEPMAYWSESPHVLAGRDARHGGTWFGVTRTGRIAFVTNVGGASDGGAQTRSRGALVRDYLEGSMPPIQYLSSLEDQSAEYQGFCLVVGTLDELWYYTNRDGAIRNLESGIYGLSNDSLDCSWPKVVDGKRRLSELLGREPFELRTEDLVQIMLNREVFPDDQLPNRGRGIEKERFLSPLFVRGETYGTRSTTALVVREGLHYSVQESLHTPLDQGVTNNSFRFSLVE